MSSKVLELFGVATTASGIDWHDLVEEQGCPYLQRKCIKNRKSQPETPSAHAPFVTVRTARWQS